MAFKMKRSSKKSGKKVLNGFAKIPTSIVVGKMTKKVKTKKKA